MNPNNAARAFPLPIQRGGNLIQFESASFPRALRRARELKIKAAVRAGKFAFAAALLFIANGFIKLIFYIRRLSTPRSHYRKFVLILCI